MIDDLLTVIWIRALPNMKRSLLLFVERFAMCTNPDKHRTRQRMSRNNISGNSKCLSVTAQMTAVPISSSASAATRLLEYSTAICFVMEHPVWVGLRSFPFSKRHRWIPKRRYRSQNKLWLIKGFTDSENAFDKRNSNSDQICLVCLSIAHRLTTSKCLKCLRVMS
jgi:hypothetical protein